MVPCVAERCSAVRCGAVCPNERRVATKCAVWSSVVSREFVAVCCSDRAHDEATSVSSPDDLVLPSHKSPTSY